jgi:hypothetical protein
MGRHPGLTNMKAPIAVSVGLAEMLQFAKKK